ncbi:MAG: hypothetical protein RL483_1452, partial [Pseudomonadota bacterium]
GMVDFLKAPMMHEKKALPIGKASGTSG